MIPLLVALAWGWEVRGPEDRPTGVVVDVGSRFRVTTPTWAGARVVTDPAALAEVAEATLAYLRAAGATDPAADPGLFAELGVDRARMEATLAHVATVARTDPDRLSDPAWILATFDVWSWTPDPAEVARRGWELAPGTIRVTRYLTTRMEGRAAPEPGFDQALWADPGEGARTRYTRREVMEGAWRVGPDAGGATPLVWVSEAGFHDALMQGSAEVHLPDGTSATYGVHVHNGIAYIPGRRGRDQDRFWYFAKLPTGPRGWGLPGLPAPPIRAGVTVAGDIYNLGLGRLMLLEHADGRGGTTLRLAVLADTGGAFQPNLAQLDWYGGAFGSHGELYAAWRDLPGAVQARVLVLKE